MKSNITTYFKATALTDEQLRLQAPSAFALSPMNGLSPRYRFVPTSEIVAGLREKNWVPTSVEQQRVRTEMRMGFQKHLLRFRRAEQMQTLDEWNAELVLTNSHDAGCAYIMQVGIYRRLCSNGLVISDDSFEAMRFRHAGLRVENVIEASFQVLEYIPRINLLIDKFRNCSLSDQQRIEFARQALLLRYANPELAPVEAQTVLVPRRAEDQSNNLWTVFNTVQENLVRGGISNSRRDRRGKLRTMRSLIGIDSRVSLNKALWSLAETLIIHRN
jgi:hypothetical protein